ncbi:ribonuclease HII [Chaetoceros tenuissimus]|uniref:Ribonuclease n=1 Tax=Chaetoceros tenuissimus TaxID=426638 RepID=A0AAD3CTS6_9STRA|nr:ribonuclease HII [Chaetoceros tenuissimus]
MKQAASLPPRRSARIQAISSNSADHENQVKKTTRKTSKRNAKSSNTESANKKRKTKMISKEVDKPKTTTPKRKSTRTTPKKKDNTLSKQQNLQLHLPRTREETLLEKYKNDSCSKNMLYVMGIDEAGRGPLAGPVVAAAAIIPTDIEGITDSKKLTKEEVREELYEKIVTSPNARWAVAIGDAKRIDEINILQTTLECMRNAARVLMGLGTSENDLNGEVDAATIYRKEHEISSELTGCYVVCGINDEKGKPLFSDHKTQEGDSGDCQYHALVDGNRVPKEMPCEAEAMVKGDSKEYAIGAASIIAKVSRDRLMHEYDKLYPEYDLKQHKGYPTAAHMKKVYQFGASKIHRRTFAPLKHMTFDKDGKIIDTESD